VDGYDYWPSANSVVACGREAKYGAPAGVVPAGSRAIRASPPPLPAPVVIRDRSSVSLVRSPGAQASTK